MQTNKSKPDTRHLLLAAAEKLFAEQGIGNVSLRQINAAAGQSNTASVLYHFGSKNALLEAILQNRMSSLDAERWALINQGSAAPDRQALLAMLNTPILYHANTSVEWCHYFVILRELMEFRHRHLRPLWRGKYDTAVGHLFGALRQFATNVDDVDWARRVEECALIGTTLIAERAQLLLQPDTPLPQQADQFAAHLNAMFAHILFANDNSG